MKVSRTFTVEIDGATFVFEKPKGNQSVGKTREENLNFIFSKLREVRGLQDEDGSDIQAEAVRSLDLPIDVINKIDEAFAAEYMKMMGLKEVPAEKKSSEIA